MTEFAFLKRWFLEFALNKYNLNPAQITFSVRSENDGLPLIFISTPVTKKRGNQRDYSRQNSLIQ